MKSISILLVIAASMLGLTANAEPVNLGLSVLPNFGNRLYMPTYYISVDGADEAVFTASKFFNYSDDFARDPKLFIAIMRGGKYAVIDTGLNASADAVQAGPSPCAPFKFKNASGGTDNGLFLGEISVENEKTLKIDYYLLTESSADDVSNKICYGGGTGIKVKDVVPSAKPIYSLDQQFQGMLKLRESR